MSTPLVSGCIPAADEEMLRPNTKVNKIVYRLFNYMHIAKKYKSVPTDKLVFWVIFHLLQLFSVVLCN